MAGKSLNILRGWSLFEGPCIKYVWFHWGKNWMGMYFPAGLGD